MPRKVFPNGPEPTGFQGRVVGVVITYHQHLPKTQTHAINFESRDAIQTISAVATLSSLGSTTSGVAEVKTRPGLCCQSHCCQS